MTSELDAIIPACLPQERGAVARPFNIILPGNDVSLRERIIQVLDAAGQSCSGIAFYSLEQFAAELLAARGIAVLDQPLTRRYLALENIIHSELPELEYFDKPRQLRQGPGYAAAFNANISECESGGLSSADLEDSSAARVRDLARLWKRADSNLGWGADDTEKIAAPGRVLHRFVVEKEKNNIEIPARFQQGLFITDELKSIEEKVFETPGLDDFILLNLKTAIDTEETETPAVKPSEDALGALKTKIFRRAPDAKQPPAKDGDDSVRFEEYSVPEREDEAAVQWLFNRLEHGDSPREIAIVYPSAERTGSLYSYIKNFELRLSARLDEKVEIPLFVPGGISLADVPGGTRIFALLRALKSFLRQDEMLALLPLLRFDEGEVYNASSQRWKSWVYDHGMVGGSPSRPADAACWLDYLERLSEAARDQLAAHERGEASHHAPSPERLKSRIAIIQQVRPALEQLIEICRSVESGEATISELWNQISAYAEKWLDTRQDGRDLLEVVDESIAGQLPATSGAISGEMALVILLDLLRNEKFPFLKSEAHGVFLGSFETARFRRVKSLRFIGLNENTLPAVPREDPVLPDRLRHQINETCFGSEDSGLADSEESARRRLRSFYHLLQSVQNRVVFSSTRRDSSNSRRAPSSLFIDLALASGKSGATIPGDDWIKEEMKRGRTRQKKNSYPLSALDELDRPGCGVVPSGWAEDDSPRQLNRLVELQRAAEAETEFSVLDGIFEKDIPGFFLSGLTPDKPLSASAAGTFVSCPHQFLLKRVLGFYEPPEPTPTAQLSALQFGSLLHEAAELIYKDLEEDAGLKSTLNRSRAQAADIYDQKVDGYGLVGTDTKRREKQRFLNAVENLIELDYEANRLGRRFELERGFGFDKPVEANSGLFISGFIDRIEHRADGTVAIRDLKSGKKKSDDELLPGYDIQLGVYRLGFIATSSEDEAVDELSFLYPTATWDSERLFSDHKQGSVKPLTRLVERTDDWLEMVKDFLEQGIFPRAEDEDDCSFCPFKPVCGSGFREKLEQKLNKAKPGWAGQFLGRKEGS